MSWGVSPPIPGLHRGVPPPIPGRHRVTALPTRTPGTQRDFPAVYRALVGSPLLSIPRVPPWELCVLPAGFGGQGDSTAQLWQGKGTWPRCDSSCSRRCPQGPGFPR